MQPILESFNPVDFVGDNLIFSTNPLRNQMSGSFTGSTPDLAVIGKHHLPIRNDTVRDMMLRFSDYLAVRRY